MTLRFWRRVRLAPGLRLNLSKSGASVSVGRRGAWLTSGPRGQRVTVGATGTGLFWTEFHPWTNHGRISQSSGGQGGMMRRPVYALAAALGSLPVWLRAVIVIAFIIPLGALGLLIGVGELLAAL
jgi:Protein of unknown function (DUF4236)